jgi:hypothetical protein
MRLYCRVSANDKIHEHLVIIIGSWQYMFHFFFIILSGVKLTEFLGTAATTGLLHQPGMIGEGDCGEKLVEWRLAGETLGLGKNLPQRHFVHHKSHTTRPGFEPGPPRWEASD